MEMKFKYKNVIGMEKVMKKMNYRNNNGITLIALVITIVVLIILSAVSINIIFNDNGIISRAGSAQKKMDDAADKEIESVNSLNNLINKKTGEEENIPEETKCCRYGRRNSRQKWKCKRFIWK